MRGGWARIGAWPRGPRRSGPPSSGADREENYETTSSISRREQASASALIIDSYVPEGAVDSVYFENTYYLGAGKNGERGYRMLTEALEESASDPTSIGVPSLRYAIRSGRPPSV